MSSTGNNVTFQSPPSSPIRHSSPLHSKKLKKPPPITPKRFTRFFTPRTASISTRGSANSSLGRAGRQLRDITKNGANRRPRPQNRTPRKTVLFADQVALGDEDIATPPCSSGRKRKAPLTPPDSSPIQPTPSKRQRFSLPQPTFEIRKDPDLVNEVDELPEHQDLPKPVQRIRSSDPTSRILNRAFGGLSVGRGRRKDHCADWRSLTESFQTQPDDLYTAQDAVPFCAATCNANSLIAVGDEDGNICLLETEKDVRSFSQPHLLFRPHTNAIMDLAFSSDDLLLATASGDQTAQIIDVQTQSTRFLLEKHIASVKQICFQPGNDKVLATSGRDGTVQLWDLRCTGVSGTSRPVLGDSAIFASSFNTINDAHTDRNVLGSLPNPPAIIGGRDVAGKTEVPSRRGEVSITSLAFLPLGRENMMLTASDASASVKLWDIRARYSRRGQATAVSATKQPESHTKHRHFGINSLCLNGDGSRFYALSKDSTVYAYSTNHLILGSAPELSSTSSRHRHATNEKQGLGPLYGFRHPRFHATTFYVKASLRSASNDKPEMLAVGSSDGSPILFPTDESLLERTAGRTIDESASPCTPTLPDSPFLNRSPLRRMASGSSFGSRMKDTIPIYEQGTPLVRGHSREVTSVSWTHSGDLISMSDDYSVRCWREDAQSARSLRQDGESEGRRWGCGWAEMDSSWDEDEV